MAAVGGSIRELSLQGRNFAVLADNDVSRKIGGSENSVEANGDGTGRLIKNQMPFNLDGVSVACDDSRGDQEFVQDIADSNDFVTGTITYADGSVWQGNVQVVGEIVHSNANAS